MSFRRASVLAWGIVALGASAVLLVLALRDALALAEPGTGPPAGAGAVLGNVLLAALFGLQHSAMARPRYRRWFARVFSPRTERVTYTLASCLALAILLAAWRPLPGAAWSVDGRFASALVTLVGAAGWVLLLGSFAAMNAWELLGVEQIVAFARRGASASRFRTPGPYRSIRHPVLAGMLLALWAAPVMSWSRFLLAAALSAYIAIGIRLEERDLLNEFGAAYARYRERVPMLLPRWRRVPSRPGV